MRSRRRAGAARRGDHASRATCGCWATTACSAATSSKPEDVDRLLDGAAIHLVNTDPPYNVKVEPRSATTPSPPGSVVVHQTRTTRGSTWPGIPSKSKPTQKKLRAKDRPLANDFVSRRGVRPAARRLVRQHGPRARSPGAAFYIWGGYANLGNYPPVLKACGLYFSQGIVWDKQHPVLTLQRDNSVRHEALSLGLWYLELALLRLFRYKGRYFNRLKRGKWLTNCLDSVPWS